MPDFRRGASAIAQAAADAKSKQKGSFSPFAPTIFWKDDGDEKYLLFLNPLEDIPQVDAIGFIPVARKKADGTKYTAYETVIARTDPALGEAEDPMVEQWDAKPKETNIAVAIELEPDFEEINGRKKPVGFKVKTREFERRVRDEDGDLTDDLETVVAPQIGFVSGSPHTLFQSISAHDQDMPLEAWPVKIKKIGSGTTQSFNVTGFEDVSVNLDDLQEIDGITYLDEDERDELYEFVPGEDTTDQEYEEELLELAKQIGARMLSKRLDELTDEDRYNTLLKGITSSLDRFGGGSKKSKSGTAAKRTAPRRERATGRRVTKKEEPAEEPETVAESEPQEEEKPKAKRATRKPAAKKPAPEPEADPEVAEESEPLKPRTAGRATNERLAALKAKAAAAKA